MRSMDHTASTDSRLQSAVASQNPSAPIRVMKVIPLFACGGTEGQVINLVRNMDRSQFDVQFACMKKWGQFLEEIEQRNIPVTEYPLKSLYKPSTFWQQLRFARYLREQRVQIVHSYNFYANVFAVPAARMAGVPVVVASIRDRGVYLTPAQQMAQKWACKLADKILVNAEAIRDWLVEDGYEDSKITTITNGIDISRYDSKQCRGQVRSDLGISSDAPLVVMLSRLNPQKGIDDFLKAAAQISRQHPQARFLVVGEKLTYKSGAYGQDLEYHQQLKQLSLDLGLEDKVIFTGHRSDVPDILHEATVSVLPSHSEGLSNTLLESMAAGVPIVATQVGGNPELVEDGVNGFLVPVQDSNELAAAISRILSDSQLADSFAQASRERAERYFSMERMVEKTQNLYVTELNSSARRKRKIPSY